MKKETYPIIGMHCASCKLLIQMMVGDLKGVSSVNVNLTTEKMSVEYDENLVTVDDLKRAVSSAGSYKMISDEPVENEQMDPATHGPSNSTGLTHEHAGHSRNCNCA